MEPAQPNSDEIDLLHLLAKFTRFLVQNWLIIGLSMACCVAVSWLSYRRAPKAFASEMIIQSRFLSETYASQVVKGLQKIIGEGNDSLVAAKLNLTKAEAALVENVSVASAFSERVSMSEDDRVVFLLSVEVSDPSVLPKLQSGLVFFLENLEFVRLRVAERRKGYQELIIIIDREIGRVDSLPPDDISGSSALLRPDRRPNKRKSLNNENVPYGVLFDPSTLGLFMAKERIEVSEKLSTLHNGIEIIQGFALSKSPIKPVFSMYLASGISSGIILTLVLLGLRSVQLLFKKYPA